MLALNQIDKASAILQYLGYKLVRIRYIPVNPSIFLRLDGTGRISVKPATNFMSLHPFSVAVFEDTIYWSDYGLRDIQSCHKFTGENHQVVVNSTGSHVYGIQIVHELLEPPLYSPCNHERCAHMCLIKKGGQEGVCKCATSFKLVNGSDCFPDEHIPTQLTEITTTRPSTTTRSTPTLTLPTTNFITIIFIIIFIIFALYLHRLIKGQQ